MFISMKYLHMACYDAFLGVLVIIHPHIVPIRLFGLGNVASAYPSSMNGDDNKNPDLYEYSSGAEY